MTQTLELGPYFDALIDDTVGAGRYSDASALVREALSLWENLMGARELSDAEIIEAVEEARRMGGEGIPLHEGMDLIRARLEAMR